MGRLRSIYINEIEVKEISIFKALLIMVIFTVIPVIANLISTVILLLIDEDMSLGSIMIVGTIVVIVFMILTIMIVARLFTNKNNIINHTVIAVGDNMNDLELLEEADYGFCTLNGSEKLKKLSKYIACSNDDNVMEFLIKWIEKEKIFSN